MTGVQWATEGQLAALAITLRRARGVCGRTAQLDWLTARLARHLDTSEELTRREAACLLAELGPLTTLGHPQLPRLGVARHDQPPRRGYQ